MFIRKLVSAFLIWSLALSWLPPADARVRGSIPRALAQNLGGIVGNMAGPTYFSNVKLFTDWAVQGGSGSGSRTLNSNAVTEQQGWVNGYFDANGNLNSGSAITGVTNMAVALFTPGPGVANSLSGATTFPPGPINATFQGTVATNVLTVTTTPNHPILPGDQVIAVGLQGTTYNIQPFGTGGTTGTGSTGTYQLSNSATISVAVPMVTFTYWWTGKVLTLTFSGSVTSVAAGGTIGTGGSFPTCTASPCTITLGYNPGNFGLTFNFPSATATPPTQIRVVEPRFASQMTACLAGTLISCWNPDAVAAIGPIGIKRVMDLLGTNSSGVMDISQYADQNYTHLGAGCGGANSFDGQISGTTLTSTNSGPFGSMYPGMLLHDATGQITANTVTQTGTGTANSTFTVNNSQTITDITGTGATSGASTTLNVTGASGTIFPFSSVSGTNIPSNGGPSIVLAAVNLGGGAWTVTMDRASTATVSGTVTFKDRMWASALPGSFIGGTGPKCGVHPSLLVALANATSTGIHFNISAGMSDAGMTNIASFFNSNLQNGLAVSYQYCNEVWNGALGICYYYSAAVGRTLVNSGTGPGASEGWQMAHWMSLVAGVYGPSNRANWRGVIGGQGVNNSAAAAAVLGGINTWIAAISPTTSPNDLFDDVVVATYVSDFSTWSTTINSMIADSTTCYTSAAATLTGASVTGTTLTFASSSGGTVGVGQGLTFAGIPASTYIVAGSGLSWTLNQAPAGTISGTMTTAPCATNFQWFAQEYSKSLITGNNEYGYTLASSVTVNGFSSALQPNALFANSNRFQLREYEGGFQVQPVTTGAQTDFLTNYFFDPAGNDPLYTPAKVVAGINQQMHNVWSAFPSHFEVYNQVGTFMAWNYPADINPMWQQLLAENAAGPYVDPTPLPTWTANYAGNGTNRIFFNSACVSCTDTLAGLNLGTATTNVFVGVSGTGSSNPASMTCDTQGGGSPVAMTPVILATPGANVSSIWRGALASNASATRSCTVTYSSSGQSFQSREYYAFTATGFQSLTPDVAVSVTTQANINTVAFNKNSLVIMMATRPVFMPTVSGAATPAANPATATIASDLDTASGHSAGFALYSPSFNTAIGAMSAANSSSGLMAVVVMH